MPYPASVVPASHPPARPVGRPANSHAAYYSALQRMATRQASVMDGLISDVQLRLSEAALIANISTQTLRRAIKAGLLPATKTTPKTGHIRIRLSALQKYLGGL